jgi:hypothetical protein
VWRVRLLGVSTGGTGPEDLADTVNNLLAYDGELVALQIQLHAVR